MACFIFRKFLIYLICINAKLNYQVKCNQPNTKYRFVPMLMFETCKYHKDINGWGTIDSTTVTLNHDTHSKCFLDKVFCLGGMGGSIGGARGNRQLSIASSSERGRVGIAKGRVGYSVGKKEGIRLIM